MTAPKLVEHFFRHEYGRLVAMLSCRVGVQHIEAVEDAGAGETGAGVGAGSTCFGMGLV